MFSNSSNVSLLPPSSDSSSSYHCYDCRNSFIIFTSYSIATILILLPPCILPFWMNVAVYLAVATTNGHVPFHILTCVERHLAVVHPITYLRLKNRGGIRIRNVSIAFVWLLLYMWIGLTAKSVILVPYFCVTTFSMVVVAFCSLSVLRALIRPGPGEGGGDKGRVDQSKKRAFRTIMAIMLALCFRFGGQLLFLLIYVSMNLGKCYRCTMLTSVVWLCLPSSLVLPLLFLHRAGKLTCCKKTDSGSDQTRVMTVNSSNASLLPPLNLYGTMLLCNTSQRGVISLTAYFLSLTLLLLPVCIRVIYISVQKWRQQPNAIIRHSDALTYNMVATELMNILGSCLSCCAAYTGFTIMMQLGIYLFLLNFSAQQYFHVLTCVERYLAVVHPIIFLKLRGNRAVRIRNVTIVCVWLLCFGSMAFLSLPEDQSIAVSFFWASLFLFVVLFCSVSVVWVLIRPKPRVGKRVDRTKVRALYYMMVILGVLVFRFGSTTISLALYHFQNQVVDEKCLALFCMIWMGLPGSLVLPLLYLHKAGKLTCCRKTDSGSDQSRG
ncbi:hypothetical protein JOQ06_020233 [Pogonophryne albipinna]|uniref:G-protein coupled receptors family 1 profile domain-containing protein n=1 Tax=Pogonophryne albipinna TaxID=1090488 RepID=A0AAD6BTA6_9TELE|nr:hypothetical protein JOQ06_020233 [Pogonophryne albipinna]